MTAASPSGPTKIQRKSLILADMMAPRGTHTSHNETNGLRGDVPHEIHPFDTLPCHIEDDGPPTAAAIVALCLIAGVAGAFGLALWVLL